MQGFLVRLPPPERPTWGSVTVPDAELTSLNGAQLRSVRHRMGMIFQHFNLLNSRTAAENVAFPLEVQGVGKSKRQTRGAELLALVGLDDRTQRFPSQLSGGQKQRVGIATANAFTRTLSERPLEIGAEVPALFKSTEVILGTDEA